MRNAKSLAQAIKLSGLKYGYVAERLGISRGTLRGKLNGEYEFKLSELIDIKKLIQGLELLTDEDFWRIVENDWRRHDARGKTWIADNTNA